jgi:predicted O-methyltransferase YrrM
MSVFNEDWYSYTQCNDLKNLALQVKNISGKVIEIGCWEGKSTCYIANTCYPENVVCNDTWLGNVQESIVTGNIHPTEVILKTRDVYQIFLNNMNSLTKGNYSVVKQDCIEWLKDYNEEIKFIHIDASHEYESVYKTIQLALPKMVKGGIICGDDFLSANIHRHDLHGGVERAVRESLPSFKNIGNLWYCVIV